MYEKILLVGHVTESYGSMQALPEYLRKKVKEFSVISHPFFFSEISNSSCVLYKNGGSIKQIEGPKYKTVDLIHFLGDIILTFYFFIRLRRKFDLFIGSDCLNAFAGIVFRQLGLVKNVIFYECDYTPERFKNKVLNMIFHWLNGFTARHADVVWNNPPNLDEIRAKQGSARGKNIRVPHGVNLNNISQPPFEKINRKVLVYTGHVTEPHGLQLLVDSLPVIVKKVPQIKVSILGSGPYERTLKKMIIKEGLTDYFKFFGYTTHSFTLQYLPTCGVGLAPYVDKEKGTFRYAEPLKVKDYLACGLPVIITKVPAIAHEIERKQLGIAINYDSKELADGVVKLLKNDEFYKKCRNAVLNYTSNITWNYTYDQAFKETLKRLHE